MYMVSSQCAPCPGGYYQSLPGQTACELCPDNKIVVDGGTNCTGITLRIDWTFEHFKHNEVYVAILFLLNIQYVQ